MHLNWYSFYDISGFDKISEGQVEPKIIKASRQFSARTDRSKINAAYQFGLSAK